MDDEEYQKHRSEMNDFHNKVRDAVEGVIRGSDWGPPAGEPQVLVDCVILLGWVDADGGYSTSHVRIGTPWATLGLTEAALQDMKAGRVAPYSDE